MWSVGLGRGFGVACSGIFVSANPVSFAGSWLLMVGAMMLPLLLRPVTHLWHRSLRRRILALFEFMLGHLSVWAAVSVPIVGFAVLLREFARGSEAAAIALGILVAAVWQLSDCKKYCLSLCHVLPRLAAFGPAASRDAAGYGVTHGFWCAGSCWAAMLPALVAGAAHTPIMAAVALLLVLERFCHRRSLDRALVRHHCQFQRRGSLSVIRQVADSIISGHVTPQTCLSGKVN